MTDIIERPASAVYRSNSGTRRLSLRSRNLPPTQVLRLVNARPDLAHDTGELPVWPTGAELAVGYSPDQPDPRPQPRPIPTPPPPPAACEGPTPPTPRPSWATGLVGNFPVVEPLEPQRPDGYRSRHRRPVRTVALPVWAYAVASCGLLVFGWAGSAMTVLAVIR